MDSTAGGEDWEVLRRFLPAGWEEEARRSGALRRALCSLLRRGPL